MNKMVVVAVCEEKHQRLLRAFVRLFSFFLLSCVCACGRFVSYFFGSADLFLLFSFFFLLIFHDKIFLRTYQNDREELLERWNWRENVDRPWSLWMRKTFMDKTNNHEMVFLRPLNDKRLCALPDESNRLWLNALNDGNLRNKCLDIWMTASNK